jgi:hypothetical protein
LIGSRNRLAVAMNWCWNYVTFQRGTRLITGISGSRIEDVLPAVMPAPPIAEVGYSLGDRMPPIPARGPVRANEWVAVIEDGDAPRLSHQRANTKSGPVANARASHARKAIRRGRCA